MDGGRESGEPSAKERHASTGCPPAGSSRVRLADSWNADRPPADWTDIRRHWWTLHTIRTAMAVLAFLALLIANVADRTKGAPPGAPCPA
ncbi:hypothetical protein AB0J63_23430 [Streptosporangium canum]|uniref:hypothetical protein n=1 Tax=Streptosporangium canum TaxID=324952 RepID=UPI003442AB16